MDLSEQKTKSDQLLKTSQADALAEANRLKDLAHNAEARLKSDYSSKLSELSDELASVKKQLADQLEKLTRLRDEFRLEKENAVSEIEEHHRLKMLAMTQTREAHEQRSRIELEERHRTEVQGAEERISKVVNERLKLLEENTRLAKESEEKLAKAQAFYDNELQVYGLYV